LVKRVRSQRQDLGLTVSATTRAPRAGEVDGQDYHFLSDEEFDARVAAGDFLEWAHIHGHRYGTLKSDVHELLQAGTSVILEIDVQGGMAVKALDPEAVLIFVAPPTLEELERRLLGRGTEDAAEAALRMKNAEHELTLAPEYDVVIVNEDVAAATHELLETMSQYEK
jgi:guanylate kinase